MRADANSAARTRGAEWIKVCGTFWAGDGKREGNPVTNRPLVVVQLLGTGWTGVRRPQDRMTATWAVAREKGIALGANSGGSEQF